MGDGFEVLAQRRAVLVTPTQAELLLRVGD